jgi:membrane protease subunit (stomatin/prohibitin family)
METNIREYGEKAPVKIIENKDNHRLVIRAYNEGGYNCTTVDLIDVIEWVKKHRPDLLS